MEVTTQQLDVAAANICSSLIAQHPDHDTLAARPWCPTCTRRRRSLSEAMAPPLAVDRVSAEIITLIAEHGPC
jgi:hypothetical protein